MESPKIRKLVTGHNATGIVFFTIEKSKEMAIILTSDAAMTTTWASETVTADCKYKPDRRLRGAGTTLNREQLLEEIIH